MAAKKVKKVTEIPEANVKIEIEQTEEESEKSETTQNLEETAEVETHDEEEESEEVIKKEPLIESFDDDESGNSISWKKVFLYTVVAAFIGFLILGGFLMLMKNYSIKIEKKTTDSKQIELPSSAPTPTVEEVNKEAYEITVLNGSGIAGEAATVQTLLEDAGFKVSEIGNAETQDFTDTEISVTDDVDKEYLDELKKALEKRGDVKVVDASSTQTENVVVTVGSNTTSNTEEITPTP